MGSAVVIQDSSSSLLPAKSRRKGGGKEEGEGGARALWGLGKPSSPAEPCTAGSFRSGPGLDLAVLAISGCAWGTGEVNGAEPVCLYICVSAHACVCMCVYVRVCVRYAADTRLSVCA